MLSFRYAEEKDVRLYYKWATDPDVRQNSFNSKAISWEEHVKWFNTRIADKDCLIYLFLDDDVPAGQVRIENQKGEHVISISVDAAFRRKGLSFRMVEMACKDYFAKTNAKNIVAYIKRNNQPSIHLFRKAGFSGESETLCKGQESVHLSINKSQFEKQN